MGRRTDLSVIRPPKVNREPYVWFRTKDLNFPGTKRPLSCVRDAWGGWIMAPSRAAAYRDHAQGCLRLADLMTSPEHRVRFHSLGFPRSRPGSGSKRLRGLRASRTYFGSPPREVACDTRSPRCLI
jgi:hypothetical protein